MGRYVALLVAGVVGSATPALAQFARISESTTGAQANAASRGPSISASGRFVAFTSDASNLVDGDTNAVSDVFLRDRDTDADGVFDESGAVSTVRISVGTAGTQSDNESHSPALSADGRFVVFVSEATNLTASPNLTLARQIYRHDRTTGTTTLVSAGPFNTPSIHDCESPDASSDASLIVFRCDGAGLVGADAGSGGNIFLRDMNTGVLTRLSPPQPPPSGPPPPAFDATVHAAVSPSISDDGRVIAFVELTTIYQSALSQILLGRVTTIDRASGVTRRDAGEGFVVTVAGDGRSFLGLVSPNAFGGVPTGRIVAHSLAVGEPVSRGATAVVVSSLAVSHDGRWGLARALLLDARTGVEHLAPYSPTDASLDAQARWVAFSTLDAVSGSDTNIVSDVYVGDYPAYFDQDHDGLDDRDETFYGLSTASGAGDDGPTGDPDNDGLTNAVEIANGSHPRGLVKRYLAEGASSDFFRTRFAIANPDAAAGHAANAVFTFSREDGGMVRAPIRVNPGARSTLHAAAVAGLAPSAFSTIVESDRPIVVERTMTWDTRDAFASPGYGAHTESAVDAPSTQWYLAEGATGAFNLYYLLQNPQTAAVDATVRYLRPDGPPLERIYRLAPQSRATIFVNHVDTALEISDVSADISATGPIIVERAQYMSRPGQPFAVGHAARGITAAAHTWFLAEGATGEFMDTYVLIANPSSAAAEIDARFDTPDSGSVSRHYTVPGNSRFTILLDSIPGLEAAAVSTAITSTTVPVVVERAMYWPYGFANYYEGHVSAGSTTNALRWVLAEGEEGGAHDAQTFLLIANTSATPGRVRLSVLRDETIPIQPEIDLPPHSRTTIRPIAGGIGRFGMLVESIGPNPVTIVVEGALYWNVDGVIWAAGSGVVATPVP